MYADLLKYFAIALFVQVALLVLAGVATYGLLQHGSTAGLLPPMIVFIVYAWPLAPFGFAGGFGIILSAPVLVVVYSLIFSVVKIKLRDRYRKA
jgi:hypothetical protein